MQTRKSPRLPEYDYTRTGMYFVTICLRGRVPLLGRVDGHTVVPSRYGEVAATEIRRLEERFPDAETDLFIVMPDHVHLIVTLGIQARALGTVVGSVKSATSREINRLRKTTGPVWQRGYYEHVIRDDADLERVREYIVTNPVRWTLRHQTGPRGNERARQRAGEACASPLRG
jgi:putative transposase